MYASNTKWPAVGRQSSGNSVDEARHAQFYMHIIYTTKEKEERENEKKREKVTGRMPVAIHNVININVVYNNRTQTDY